MIIRPASQWPVIFTFRLLDREIIDARVAVMHDATFVELPVLVSVRPKPIAGIIMPFIGKTNSDARSVKRPQLLDESVVQFTPPFACKKLLDFLSADHTLRPITPVTIDGISQTNFFWISGVPSIFASAYFHNCRLVCEGWDWIENLLDAHDVSSFLY